MDKKKLRELINLFKESGLAKMEITENSAEENYSLKLESGAAAPAYMPAPGEQGEKGGYALHHRGDEADERRRCGDGRRNRGNLRGKRFFGRIRADFV